MLSNPPRLLLAFVILCVPIKLAHNNKQNFIMKRDQDISVDTHELRHSQVEGHFCFYLFHPFNMIHRVTTTRFTPVLMGPIFFYLADWWDEIFRRTLLLCKKIKNDRRGRSRGSQYYIQTCLLGGIGQPWE